MINKCLIAGLPSAGKSTYIAALWAIEKDGDTGHELTITEYPADTTYLDRLRASWQGLRPVERTSLSEPVEIELKMKNRKSDKEISLLIPDFKGEHFQQVLANVVSDDVKRWCGEARSILFFMRDVQPFVLQDDVPNDHTSDMPQAGDDVNMTLKDIPALMQNVMLLKYLSESMPGTNISVCFSAIDTLGIQSPIEEWVKMNLPFLHRFLRNHFRTVNYFGVSGQGLDYDDTTLSEDEMIEKTMKKERAYIYTDRQDFDLTKPLAALLNK